MMSCVLFKKRDSRGFTLIELMVVIAIIGLLSSVVLASISAARLKARDVHRGGDLRQIANALELYYTDNRSYPNTNSTWRSQCSTWGAYSQDTVIPGITPNYLPTMPPDPAMDAANSTCCYIYVSNGTDYALLDHQCSELNYDSQPGIIDPARDGGSDACSLDGSAPWAWKIYSPGGKCW